MSLELLLRATAAPATPTPWPWSPPRSTPWPSGGIYDHLGGGFARYSVDARLAGAPLREDALRPGPAGPGLPPRLAGHRRGPLPPGARRDHRLRAPRPAPPRRRLLLGRGRRLRGRGGQVLRLDARTSSRERARRRRRRRPSTGAASPPAGNFEGAQHPPPAARGGDLARPAGVEAARQRAVRRPRAAGAARPRRQGPHRVERPVARHPGRGGGRHRASRLAGGRRRPRRVPARRPAPAPTAAGCARGRPTAAPATWPTPPTTPPWSTPSPAWPRPPARPAGSPRPGPPPTPCSTCSGTTSGGGLFTTGHDAEALVARQQGPDGQRHPVGQQPGRRGPPPPRRPHRRRPLPRARPRPSSRLLGRPAGAAPHRLRPPAGRRRPAGRPASPRSPWSATAPTWSTPCSAATCPTRCWPGASPTTRRCGRAATTAGPTSAELRLPGARSTRSTALAAQLGSVARRPALARVLPAAPVDDLVEGAAGAAGRAAGLVGGGVAEGDGAEGPAAGGHAERVQHGRLVAEQAEEQRAEALVHAPPAAGPRRPCPPSTHQ